MSDTYYGSERVEDILSIRALSLNFVQAAGTKTSSVRKTGWKCPLTGYLALNVDASFDEDTNSGSFGAVIRDRSGSFVKVSMGKLEHVADIISPEAAALFEGLKLAQMVGGQKMLVQMDNLVIVDALTNNTGYEMVAAPILKECRLLLQDFGKVSLEHCFGEANSVAHELAKKGRVDPPNLWTNSPPGIILVYLAEDVNLFEVE